MKPDKIYIAYEYSEIDVLPPGVTQKQVFNKDVCYIRKDALLEWAKFVLKCQEEELAKYDGPSYMRASTMGRIDAYKVVIAKLNSM